MRWPLVYGPHTNSSYVDRPYKRYNLLLAHGDHNHPNKAMTEEIFERIAQDWKLAPPVSQIVSKENGGVWILLFLFSWNIYFVETIIEYHHSKF